MQKELFKYYIKDNQLIIKNLRKQKVSVRILLFGITYQCLLNQEVSFEGQQELVLNLHLSPFHAADISHKLTIRVYESGKRIVDDFVSENIIEKAYVLISNDKYESITEKLLDGLGKYSNIPILHYTINYDSDLEYSNLQNIRFDVPGDSDQQYMQFMKAPVFIDVIKRGVQHAVFLDSDIQVRKNIDTLFDIPQITSGPILQKQRWEYVIANGIYIPGPLVSNYMGFEGENFQIYPNGITYLVIFNQSHLELFEEWQKICFSKEIQEIRKTEFLHDELLLNCLLWKLKMPPYLVNVGINVATERDVKYFYGVPNLSGDFLNDMNEKALGHFSQSYIPFDKNDILFFHCIKDLSIAQNVNDIISQEESDNKGSDSYFKEKLIDFYKNIETHKSIKKLEPKFSFLFHDGAFFEAKDLENEVDVLFIDEDTEKIRYQTKIQNNCWSKTSQRYYVNWRIIAKNEETYVDYKLDYQGHRVFISFESSALGDTLAWIPYVEEFRKKHNCHVVCSTFWNSLFEESYPEIEFITPGLSVPNVFGIYRIGWFYDDNGNFRENEHKNNFRLQPLQKTASDILGLEFTEIRPKIKLKTAVSKEKIISIGIHGTAQTKYWNNPNGWQEIVDYFKSNGYEVVIISKEGDGYMGNPHPKGAIKANTNSIEEVIEILQRSELFIGIGSGLSWLSWSVGTPTVLISGFSYDYTEPSSNIIRITAPDGKCSGCFNTHRLDPGDWNWCPLHKGTERQFECSKSITSNMVIDRIISSNVLKSEKINEWRI